MPGVTSCRYAPMPTVSVARTAVILPSAVAASSISWIWSRPWIVDDVALAARLRPLHGAAEPARDRERERLLGVDVQLRAEAAADVGRDHAQLRLGDAGDAAERDAGDVRHLRRRPERELAGRRDRRDEHGARLDRVRDQPVLAIALLDRDGGLGEQPVDLARVELPRVAAVRAELLVDERRALCERRLGVDDDRQRLVVDLDELRRVLGGAAARRRDHRDRVADVARLVDRERLVLRRIRVLGRNPRARQRALPLIGEVGARPRRDDARVREGRVDVHVLDSRVRVRAAHDAEKDHPGLRSCCPPTAPGPAGASCLLFARPARRSCAPISTSAGALIVPPPRSPRRCSGSRCSGRCSPRARAGSRPRSGSGSPRAGSTAASTIPLVQ